MKEERTEQIMNILINHKGSQNAITASKIAVLCGMSKTEGHSHVRKKILEIIDEYNLPIGSNNKGYYIISNIDEYNDYITHLDNRINEMLRREDLLKRSYSLYYEEE